MKKIASIIAVICLIFTIVPAFLTFFQIIPLETNKHLMLAGTIGWFLTAPFWMDKKEETEV